MSFLLFSVCLEVVLDKLTRLQGGLVQASLSPTTESERLKAWIQELIQFPNKHRTNAESKPPSFVVPLGTKEEPLATVISAEPSLQSRTFC